MAHPLRILYAAGPGDVIGTYGYWKQGQDDPSQVAVTYSGQFYSLCKEIGAEGLVISSCRRIDRLKDGLFEIEHRPIPYVKGPAPLYHLGQVWYGVRLAMSAVRFGADVAVVSDGAHWFTLALMPLLGIKIVPTLHCVLWRKGQPPKGLPGRTIRWLNARFFRRSTSAVLSLSSDITNQLNELLGGRHKSIIPFLPTYRAESFRCMSADSAAPPQPGTAFRVFFAGRIERNKGVFDLLDIATRFAAEGRTDIEFDLCGDGSALPALREELAKTNLADRFRCHGHCDKPRMRQMYSAAHVVIAPTTSDFVEGFNKVVAEGVLAGKPVITSSVCPALEYVRDAVMEAPVNDVKTYGDAILRLADDPALYKAKIAGCEAAQCQFYDATRGWGAAVKEMLREIGKLGR